MFGLGNKGTVSQLDSSVFQAPKKDPPMQQQTGNLQEQQEEEEKPDVLQSLFEEEQESDEDRAIREAKEAGTLGPDGKPLTQEQISEKKTKTLGEQITAILSGANMTAADIPEDYDPTDPAKVTEFMNKQMQKSATAAVQANVTLLQQTFTDFEARMTKMVKDTIQGSSKQSGAIEMLKKVVPEYDNPQHQGLIKTFHEQAMKKAKNDPTVAANLVRQIVDTLGLSGGKKESSSNPSQGVSRSGPDMLKGFFGQG